jgi:hypothetical protein
VIRSKGDSPRAGLVWVGRAVGLVIVVGKRNCNHLVIEYQYEDGPVHRHYH